MQQAMFRSQLSLPMAGPGSLAHHLANRQTLPGMGFPQNQVFPYIRYGQLRGTRMWFLTWTILCLFWRVMELQPNQVFPLVCACSLNMWCLLIFPCLYHAHLPEIFVIDNRIRGYRGCAMLSTTPTVCFFFFTLYYLQRLSGNRVNF